MPWSPLICLYNPTYEQVPKIRHTVFSELLDELEEYALDLHRQGSTFGIEQIPVGGILRIILHTEDWLGKRSWIFDIGVVHLKQTSDCPRFKREAVQTFISRQELLDALVEKVRATTSRMRTTVWDRLVDDDGVRE